MNSFFNKPISSTARNIIISASYVFLTALFFAGGYSIGYHNGGGMISTPVAVTTQAEDSTPEPSPTIEPSFYRVILEDGELRLYKDENGSSRLISHEEISEGAFPGYDIEILKGGRSFPTIEDALELMENFLS